MLRVLGLILARGGSKGVPRKNIRPLAGKPLLVYTAEAALSATLLTRVIVSTDDEEIADVARRYGLEVPFLRPAALAADDTPSLPVVQHALQWTADHGEHFDAVCQLQPTSPLRPAGEIDHCISVFEARAADCVMTMARVPDEYNPHWVYFQRPDGSVHLTTGDAAPISRRQLLPPAYHRDGSVYITQRDVIMERNSLYGSRVFGVVVDAATRVNLDTPEDFDRAERILRTRSPATARPEADGAA